MTAALARNMYRQADSIASRAVSQPYDVVQITLRELNRSLGVLALSQETGRKYQPEQINRALTAIYILQSSLDFEEGGDIALDLFQLYEFARFHVLKAFRNEDDARLRDAASTMNDIMDAWLGIGAEVRSVGK